MPRVLVASPNYLQRRGTPSEPCQLADHNCLGYSNLASGLEWTFTAPAKSKQTVTPSFCFECDNGEVLADLASLGEGITLLPRFIVEKHLAEEKLQTILVDWQAPEIWLTAYYPPYDVLPAKVKAFTTFIEDSIGTDMKAM